MNPEGQPIIDEATDLSPEQLKKIEKKLTKKYGQEAKLVKTSDLSPEEADALYFTSGVSGADDPSTEKLRHNKRKRQRKRRNKARRTTKQAQRKKGR